MMNSGAIIPNAGNTCNHIHEPEELCAVKRAVARGDIFRERYENYVQIHEELKEAERR